MNVQSEKGNKIGKKIEDLMEALICGFEEDEKMLEREIDKLQEEYFVIEGVYFRSVLEN
ncbi:hypothetical protein [Cytobacillus gottheilii]|uniref:hypothetical protein n=1 Tax=Cytobacillus gottheilii TaxID=859144 RepID=UPI001594500C|nr:hypothetical protein [Cytobacillus gottheilii]